MAVGKWKIYEQAKKWLADGTFDLDENTNWKMGVFLVASNCNDLTLASPIFGNLTNPSINLVAAQVAITPTWNEAAGTATFDCGDPVFTASGGSSVIRYAVIYKDATVNTIVKPCLAVCLLDTTPGDITVTDGNTLTIGTPSGVFTLSGAAVDA